MEKQTRVNAYELFMVALSAYVLLAMFIERVFTVTPKTSEILSVIDTAICAVFLADFFLQLRMAPNKREYLRTWGWIDFISSIPALPILRWGRLFRIYRVLKVLRTVRAIRILVGAIFAHRAKGAVATVLLLCLVLVAFGSVAILHFETEPESNIHNLGDALWWSLATVATVGSGDKYPVTPEGRAVGIALMVAGVCLFGTFTAYLASWFMEADGSAHESTKDIPSELSALRAEIQQLRAEVTATRARSPATSSYDPPLSADPPANRSDA